MIGFRIDANEKVATGHMFRCISIAKKARALGEDCLFFTCESSDAAAVTDNGFEVVKLPLIWDNWDENVNLLKEECVKNSVRVLVVDSYYVTEKFFKEISETVPVFYLDDICEKKYPVHSVLHYSEWDEDDVIARLYKGTDTKVYSGMKYVPLREGFGREGTHDKYDVLVTTGGSDTYHISLLLALKFMGEEWKDKRICMVLGKMNNDSNEIRELASKYSGMTVLQNISNMDEIISESSFAVCAGGISVYEMMAGGTPFTCFAFSDDQKIFGERLSEHGNCTYAGDARDDANAVAENVVNNLRALFSMSDAERQVLIDKNKNTADGKGAERIAKIVVGLNL